MKMTGVRLIVTLLVVGLFVSRVVAESPKKIVKVTSFFLHGVIWGVDTLKNSVPIQNPLSGSVVQNLSRGGGVAAGAGGMFRLPDCQVGDSIKFSYIGYTPSTIVLTDKFPIDVKLDSNYPAIVCWNGSGSETSYYGDSENVLDIEIIDENGTPIGYDQVVFERVVFERGEVKTIGRIYPSWLTNRNQFRFY
ncbi:MAG: hypothetical protein NC336_05215 [Clostridium sp.]|nr:hypothetical protein [Clostridium sp.]